MKTVYFQLLFLIVVLNVNFANCFLSALFGGGRTSCYKSNVMDCVKELEGKACILSDRGFERDCVRCSCDPHWTFRCETSCYPSQGLIGLRSDFISYDNAPPFPCDRDAEGNTIMCHFIGLKIKE